jgi:putative ABC transport system permease protein
MTMAGGPEFNRHERSRLFQRVIEDEVDAEVEFHLAMRIRHYEALGFASGEARERALRDFGDLDAVRRACRHAGHERDTALHRARYLDEIRQDIRFTLRQLRVAPLFSAIAILTLALGIGATTSMFSLLRGVLFEPLPFRDPDRVVVGRLSLPDYNDLRRDTNAFERLSVFATNLETLTGTGEPEQVLAGVVSADFFDTLGVKPFIGRSFTATDGPSRLVVLSHSLWQRRFGGDAGIVGRTFELSRAASTVVGVMPPGFEFPTREFELWLPLQHTMSGRSEQAENRALRIFNAVGRLRAGSSLEQAQAQASALSARLARDFPDSNRGVEIRFVSAYERLVGEVRRPLQLLFAAVGLVLVIVCANLANLLLARASTREHELAIRSALGAGRARLGRQLLTEAMVLALAGGALGVALAYGTLGALVRFAGALAPRIHAIRIDGGVLLVALLVSLATGLLFGIVPALQQTGAGTAWREGGRGLAGPSRGQRLRALLIAGEVTLAAVVLVSAGLLVRSLTALVRVDPGFIADRLLTMNVVLVRKGDGPRRAEAARAIVDALAGVPGVVSVGGATGLPPQTAQRGTRFEIEDAPSADTPPGAYFIATTPDYFRALGAPVHRGRAFTERDTPVAPLVVIVNESLAKRFFGDRDPIGRRVRVVNPEYANDWRTIVGVVPDVRYQGLDDLGEATIYVPFAQTPFLWMYVFVRTQGDPAALTTTVSRTIAERDPDLYASRIQPMSALVHASVEDRRASTLILSGFAVVALLLAAMGIGGLVSYAVTRRTPEMAVRLALGGSPGEVARLVIGEALLPVAGGTLAGLFAAFFVTRAVAALLFEVTPRDGTTFASAGLLLAAVAFAAAYLPARRALRIAPADALRVE